MDFFTAMRISSAGMTVQRTRMNVTSSNMANVETTRTEEGGPYRRRSAIVAAVPAPESFGEALNGALAENTFSSEVVAITASEGEGRLVYDPQHPDANAQGYVAMPDVNVVTEMVDMLTASRSYEANVSAYKAIKGMAQSALEVGD